MESVFKDVDREERKDCVEKRFKDLLNSRLTTNIYNRKGSKQNDRTGIVIVTSVGVIQWFCDNFRLGDGATNNRPAPVVIEVVI